MSSEEKDENKLAEYYHALEDTQLPPTNCNISITILT